MSGRRPGQRIPPLCGETDVIKNITLPQTSLFDMNCYYLHMFFPCASDVTQCQYLPSTLNCFADQYVVPMVIHDIVKIKRLQIIFSSVLCDKNIWNCYIVRTCVRGVRSEAGAAHQEER